MLNGPAGRAKTLLWLVFLPLGVAALIPATIWHHRGKLPTAPTGQPSAAHVASCQQYASRWDPEHSNRSLRRWTQCMEILP